MTIIQHVNAFTGETTAAYRFKVQTTELRFLGEKLNHEGVATLLLIGESGVIAVPEFDGAFEMVDGKYFYYTNSSSGLNGHLLRKTESKVDNSC